MTEQISAVSESKVTESRSTLVEIPWLVFHLCWRNKRNKLQL